MILILNRVLWGLFGANGALPLSCMCVEDVNNWLSSSTSKRNGIILLEICYLGEFFLCQLIMHHFPFKENIFMSFQIK